MKRLIIYRFFVLFMGLILTHIACAQTEKYDETDLSTLAHYVQTSYCPHELSVWATGGVSTFDYRQSAGKTNDGMSGAFGLGYTRFLNQNLGLSFGAEYAFYQKSLKADLVKGAYDTYDIEGNSIVYHSLVENYRERQQLGVINFPLTALYQAGDKHKCYASLGLKLGLPVYGQYKGSDDAMLTASGYYPDYDQTEIWQNDFGYGVFPVENKKSLDFGLSLMGTFETGAKWNIGIGKDLYTGVFMDYGFNNTLKSSNPSRFVEYNHNEPTQPVMNSLLASQNSKVSPFTFGLKLKMAFSVGCRDLLNDRRTYKTMQFAGKQNDDYFDFNPYMPNTDTIPVRPVVVPEETIKIEMLEEVQQPDLTVIYDERLAYLEEAKERRQKYSQSMNVLSMRNMGNYDLGIVTLTAEQESALDDYIDVMTENSQIVLNITGHTCDLGTDELNMRIGQERADLAKDYLVEKGVAPSRIQTFSKGKTEPLFPNNNEVNRKKNRRLEIVIKK